MKIHSLPIIEFHCNICGDTNIRSEDQFHRELRDCTQCGSTPRFRGTIHALSVALFKCSIDLIDFPVDKCIRGIGMSEWPGYAGILAEKFSFINTYYHQEPYLDITSTVSEIYRDLDFVLCMEVLEHIPEPLAPVIANLHGMLKSGGHLILSTPFTDRATTKEHFPNLAHFATVELDGSWLVVAKNRDGTLRLYDKDIYFHGGPGTVLEMRVFAEQDLYRLLRDAKLKMSVYDGAVLEIGYYWRLLEERKGDGVGLNYIIAAQRI